MTFVSMYATFHADDTLSIEQTKDQHTSVSRNCCKQLITQRPEQYSFWPPVYEENIYGGGIYEIYKQ